MREADMYGAKGAETRLEWVTPNYTKVRAGDAEVGPNPTATDGAFTNS